MTNRVLILSEPGDGHAIAVAEAIARKGGTATLWFTSDFPQMAQETVVFAGNEPSILISGPDFDLLELPFTSVWRRRPSYVLNNDAMHPADLEFADRECAIFRRSLMTLLHRSGGFWVNNPDAAIRASSKMLQHSEAANAGFRMPTTVFTNDPNEIRRFLRSMGGRVVYKPFRAVSWQDEDTAWMPFTAIVTEADLVSDELLLSVPGIYQELVPKAYELRVTAMGKRLFAARILSQSTVSGKLDWRMAYDELTIETCELPPQVEQLCVDLMTSLGLVFGCFDFIVTPDQEHVFLEINEMGQFLFVERYTAQPLIDAFSEFLLQGRIDFDWSAAAATIRYEDIEPVIAQTVHRSCEVHVVPPPTSIWEGRSERRTPRLRGK